MFSCAPDEDPEAWYQTYMNMVNEIVARHGTVPASDKNVEVEECCSHHIHKNESEDDAFEDAVEDTEQLS